MSILEFFIPVFINLAFQIDFKEILKTFLMDKMSRILGILPKCLENFSGKKSGKMWLLRLKVWNFQLLKPLASLPCVSGFTLFE